MNKGASALWVMLRNVIWGQLEWSIEAEPNLIRNVTDSQRRPFRMENPAVGSVAHLKVLGNASWPMDPKSLHGSYKLTLWTLPAGGELLFELKLDITSWAQNHGGGIWTIELNRAVFSMDP
jgi:hypothetical protein